MPTASIRRWEAIPGAPTSAGALTVDKRGYVYWAALGCIYQCVDGVTDRRPRECHAESDEGVGPVLVFKRDVGSISTMCTTPGGWICACEPVRREVWLYSRAMLPDRCIATGLAAESCVCSRSGWLYLAETSRGKLWLIDMGPSMDKTPVPRSVSLPVAGQAVPRSLAMSVDQRTLYVAAGAATVWGFSLTTTGSLQPSAMAQGFCPAEPPAPTAELRIKSMCVAGGTDSSAGALLVATTIGLQIFDSNSHVPDVDAILSANAEPSSENASAALPVSSSQVTADSLLLDRDERLRIADDQHHRWAIDSPNCVTSVVVGPGEAAQWPHIEPGVKYDTSSCYIYATVATLPDGGTQLLRCLCSWSAVIPSEDVPDTVAFSGGVGSARI